MRIMFRILTSFLLVASVFLTVFASAAEETLPTGDFDELDQGKTAEVIKIIDPQTLQLHDGRIITLAGVNFPDFHVHHAGKLSVTARNILRDMLEGEGVTLYQTKRKDWGRMNRMGHHFAHLERKSDKAWVQGTLISLGLARVMTAQRNPEMAGQMYDLEKIAREQKIGLWESSDYAIKAPDEVENYIDSFQIVEGRVVSAAMKQNRTYLNFGNDWRTDFTVSIAPENKRLFSQKMINPLNWNNKTLRVRGWVTSYNGPLIEINHPEAVEALEDKNATKTIDTNH